jgi:hypothetical protein
LRSASSTKPTRANSKRNTKSFALLRFEKFVLQKLDHSSTVGLFFDESDAYDNNRSRLFRFCSLRSVAFPEAQQLQLPAVALLVFSMKSTLRQQSPSCLRFCSLWFASFSCGPRSTATPPDFVRSPNRINRCSDSP